MRFWYFFLFSGTFLLLLCSAFLVAFMACFFLCVTLWQIIAESSLNLRYRSALILVRLLLLDSSCHPWLTADEAVTAVWPLLFDIRWHISLSWLTTSLCPSPSPSLTLSVWGPTVKHARLLIYFHAQKGTESPRSLPNPIAAPYHIISRPNEFQMMRQFFSLFFFSHFSCFCFQLFAIIFWLTLTFSCLRSSAVF